MAESVYPYRDRNTNQYCKTCGKHLGLLYHDTSEHDKAVENLEHLNAKFNQQPETD